MTPLKKLWDIQDTPSSVFYHNITGIFRGINLFQTIKKRTGYSPPILGNWENRNISIPDTTNKTAVDEARSKFKFEGPGSFSINLKATKTANEDINYMEVCTTYIPTIR